MRIVVKVGTHAIANKAGKPDHAALKRLVEQLSGLRKAGHEVFFVSSGAVAAGVEALGLKARPSDVNDVQMCAAVGQARFIYEYERLFAEHGVKIGQILLTHYDFEDHHRAQNVKKSLDHLVRCGIVPVINENDVVADEELKGKTFGDNDWMSYLIARLVKADTLVLLTTVDGLLDAKGRRIPRVDASNDGEVWYVVKDTSKTETLPCKGEKYGTKNVISLELKGDYRYVNLIIMGGPGKDVVKSVSEIELFAHTEAKLVIAIMITPNKGSFLKDPHRLIVHKEKCRHQRGIPLSHLFHKCIHRDTINNALPRHFNSLMIRTKTDVQGINLARIGGFHNLFNCNRAHINLSWQRLQAIEFCVECLIHLANGTKLFVAPQRLGFFALEVVVRNVATIVLIRFGKSKRIRRFDCRIEIREFRRIHTVHILIDICRECIIKGFSFFEHLKSQHLFKRDRLFCRSRNFRIRRGGARNRNGT